MAKVGLQGARVGALVRKLKAAGVPEHVRVGLEANPVAAENSCFSRRIFTMPSCVPHSLF
jgi:hypothetical protein